MHTEQKQFWAAQSNSTDRNIRWSFQFYGLITSWFILLASNPAFELHVLVLSPSLQQLKGTLSSLFFSCHLLPAQSVDFTIPQHLNFMENKQEKCLLFGCLFSSSKQNSVTTVSSSPCATALLQVELILHWFCRGLISQKSFHSRFHMMSYRVFSFTWSMNMFLKQNKRKRLHKNRVQFPED